MTNRLPNFLKIVVCANFFIFFLAENLLAQSGAFNFSYPGPTQIGVGQNCDTNLAGKLGTPVVTSNSGASITMSMYDSVATGFGLYDPLPIATYSISWLVKDNMGRTANFIFNVSLTDNTPPVFDLTNTSPTLNVASVALVPPPTLPVSDNCTATGNIVRTFNQTNPPALCAAGTFTRTWTATDQSGNTTAFIQTVNISADVDPPSISVLPQGGLGLCPNVAANYGTWLATQRLNFSASDPSGILSKTDNALAAYPAGCPAPVTVIFRATDNCNIFATASATFSAADNAAPVVVSPPKDTVFFCQPDSSYVSKLGDWIRRHGYAQVTDNCTPAGQLEWFMLVNGNPPRDSAQVVTAFFDSFDNASCGFQQVGSTIYAKVRGYVPVDFFVKDKCGQQTFVGKSYFIVRDTTGPSITGTTKVESCGDGNDQTALQNWINERGNAVVRDGCSTVTFTKFTFTTSNGQNGMGNFGAGPYPMVVANQCTWHTDVTFFATDDCGNTGSGTIRFEVRDTTAPNITIANPVITVYCPNDAPSVPPVPILTDNCDLAPTATFTQQTIPNPNPVCAGNYTVKFTWTAADQCGNTRTAIQTYLVRDTIGPVFTQIPGPLSFRCDSFTLPPIPVMGNNIMATDECSPVQSISTQTISGRNTNSATCGHYNYAITRIFIATDGCGNTRTATQIIQVVDNRPPVFSGRADTTLLCSVAPVLPSPIATDACSGLTPAPILQSSNDVPGACPNAYTRTLVWRIQDLCGNTAQFTQTIRVIDTIRPALSGVPADITVSCLGIPAPPALGSFTLTDNCDTDVSIALTTTEVRDPNPASCARYHNYQIRRTWTATDNCSNTRASTQTITVRDDVPPQITLPAAITRPADAGQCGATVTIPAPIALFDECTALITAITRSDTLALTNSTGMFNSTIPVSPLNFSWPAPGIPPAQPVIGTPTLTLYLDNVDANQTSEFFKVSVEGDSIGRTAVTLGSNSCVNNTTILATTATQLNRWLTDGQLSVTLTTNGTGSNAINYVGGCTGVAPRVRAVWSFTMATPQVPVSVTYKIDTLAEIPLAANSSGVLSVGPHVIRYTARDCVGNSTTSTLSYTIQDTEPPVLTPPAAQTGYVGTNNCVASGPLPFPLITDNCTMSGSLNQASVVVPLVFETDPDAGVVPKLTNLSISGLIPNAVGSGTLRVRFKGDNAGPLEYFTIRDENNTVLQNTTQGTLAEECSTFHETIIPLTAVQINQWAANGVTNFSATGNRAFANNPNEVINNCDPVDQTTKRDGVSALQVVLEYNYAVVNYDVLNAVNTPVQSGMLNGNQTTYNNLAPGNYNVRYRTTDRSGVLGQIQFPLTVRDTVRPTARCKLLTTIIADASGLLTDTLKVNTINNGSTDNCINLTYSLSRTLFTCDDADAPAPIPVTLAVRDAAGNTAVCNTLVKVETPILAPSYNAGVCEQGTLFLFSNIALVQGSEGYNYKWFKPDGSFFSFDKNPVVTNTSPQSEGTYRLEITAKTGISGCMASGTITVDLNNLPGQPIITANKSQYCAGEPIVLSTNRYGGTIVEYQWYLCTPGTDILVQKTGQENYSVQGYSPGTYQFYVKISSDGCASINSSKKTVSVFSIPTAQVREDAVRTCIGQPITVGTNVFAPDMTYQWSGPAGFNYAIQNPPSIATAVAANAGNYILVITQNGCVSQPDTAIVTVDQTPPPPQITGQNKVCAGATITLTCQPPNATRYTWVSPDLDSTGAFINALTLENLLPDDSGNWKVIAELQGCKSEPSLPFNITVQAFPNLAENTKTPLCGGGTLRLRASADIPNLQWEWTGPGNFTAFQQNADRLPVVPGPYRVIGRIPVFGCSDTAIVNVTVALPPKIDTLITTAIGCVSGNTDAVIRAVVTSGARPLIYKWSLPNMQMVQEQDSVFTISTINKTDNGNYTLVVENAAGCISQSKAQNISVRDAPVPPVLVATPASLCPGQSFVVAVTNAEAYNGMTPTYIWTTPTLVVPISSPQLGQFSASKVDSGLYCVSVITKTCPGDAPVPALLSVNVEIKTTPEPPVVFAVDQVLCTGETLKLRATTTTGASYFWQGPDTWTSSNQNPELLNVDATNSGIYKAYLTVNGCQSAFSDTLVVKVNPGVNTPFAQPATPQALCKSNPAAFLKLEVGPNNLTPGAQYQWIHVATNTPVGVPSADVILVVPFSSMPFLAPGPNTFYAVAIKNGCSSANSNAIVVLLDTVPSGQAFAGINFIACAGNPITLNANDPKVGTGTWSLQSGALGGTIVSPNSASTLVTGLLANREYTYIWKLSNGACRDYSTAMVKVTVNAFDPPSGGLNVNLCTAKDTISAQLAAVKGTNPKGRWTQLPGQAIAGVKIAQADSFKTRVSGLRPGQVYYFYWTLADLGCGTPSDTVTVHIYASKVYGGNDVTNCDRDGCAILNATPVTGQGETGFWSSSNAALTYEPNVPTTKVCNLTPGINTLYWNSNPSVCGVTSRDTVIITFEKSVLRDDYFDITFGSNLSFSIHGNDKLLPVITKTIGRPPQRGRLDIINLDNGLFMYTPNATFSGIDSMQYIVCSAACPDACETATVYFNVGQPGECVIPTIITPNGDKANDNYIIPSSCFFVGEGDGSIPVTVEVSIYNQWGDQIYFSKNYDNNNPWTGVNSGGEELPVGTYFYLIRQGDKNTRKGFIVLQR